jgi:hypothetical protein
MLEDLLRLFLNPLLSLRELARQRTGHANLYLGLEGVDLSETSNPSASMPRSRSALTRRR